MLIKAMSELRPDLPIKQIDTETISFPEHDGSTATMSFHNVWLTCKENDGNRLSTLRNWLYIWEKSADDHIYFSGTLVAAIRNYGDALNSQEEGGEGPAGIEIAPGLQALFVLDSESGMVFMKTNHEFLIDANYKELLPKAIENLRTVLPPNVEVYKTSDYTWLLRIDNNYESSLILFDDIMSFMEKEANGKLIFCVPTREILLCAYNESDRLLQHLKKSAKEAFESGPYSLSPNVYSWKNGVIELVDI